MDFFLSAAIAQWYALTAIVTDLGKTWVRIPAKPNLI